MAGIERGARRQRAQARRYRSRRNSQFGPGHWERVEELLREEWSPEQVSGHLRLKRELGISHETIYRHIWRDLEVGARCTNICAVRARAAGNAPGVTTAEGDWRESE
jgi:IS30 family transposase